MSHTMYIYIYTHSKSPLKENTFKIEVTDQTSNDPGPRPVLQDVPWWEPPEDEPDEVKPGDLDIAMSYLVFFQKRWL